MCGILVYPKNLDFNSALAEKIVSERGKDQFNKVEIDDYVFCHSRLIISGDASTGIQPVVNSEFVLLFNGEIYNLDFLNTLADSDFESDTLLIEALILKFGVSIIDALDGPFAIVIYWKSSKEVLLLRDHLGEKPLFYSGSYEKKTLFISSDFRVFHRCLGRKVEKERAAEFVRNGYCSGSSTVLDSVFRAAMNIPDNIFYDAYVAAVNSSGDGGLHGKLLYVARNIYRDDSAVLLSGGIDSSLISCLFRRGSKNNVVNYSLKISDSLEHSEAESARKLAIENGQRFEVIEATNVYSHSNIEDTLSLLSEPIGDPGILNQAYVVKKIRDSHKIVFVGTGGDEIFLGYPKYRFLLLGRVFERVPERIKLKIVSLIGESVRRNRVLKLFGMAALDSVEEDRRSFLPNQLFASFDSITFISGIEARTPYTSILLRDYWVKTDIKHALHFIFLKLRLKLVLLLHYKKNFFGNPKRGFTNNYDNLKGAQKDFSRFFVKPKSSLEVFRLFMLNQWLLLNESDKKNPRN